MDAQVSSAFQKMGRRAAGQEPDKDNELLKESLPKENDLNNPEKVVKWLRFNLGYGDVEELIWE